MLLLAEWAAQGDLPKPVVLTVDHALQSGSQKQAERVRKLARDHRLVAHILPWKGPKPAADIEAEARAARYRLMGEWCRDNGIRALFLAHNLEDQAETFLLRLARGSGLDGLAAMRPLSPLPIPEISEVDLVRPLLSTSRHELREFLALLKVEWADDPMNTDPRFTRSRIRKAWPHLESLGLTAQRIADAAQHLGRARAALDQMTDSFLQRGVRFQAESAQLDPLRLGMLPREVGLRALATVLSRVSGQEYRPRFDSLERLFEAVVQGTLGGGATLHGCLIGPAQSREQVFGTATLAISREPVRQSKEPQPSRTRKS